MKATSLLNSGADINTKDRRIDLVCIVICMISMHVHNIVHVHIQRHSVHTICIVLHDCIEMQTLGTN